MNLQIIPNVITVAYEEAQRDSPVERYAIDGSSELTRVLYCDWSDVDVFVEQLLGQITMVADSGPIVYRMPHSYPIQGRQHYVAIDASLSGRGYYAPQTSHVTHHQEAEVTVTYRASPIDDSTGEVDAYQLLADESIRFQDSWTSASNRKLYWNNDDTGQLEPDERPELHDATMEWIYTIRRLPRLDLSTISGYIDNVNSVALTSRKYNTTFAARRLLFLPPEISAYTDRSGRHAWTVTYHMLMTTHEWNKFPPAGGGAAATVYMSGGSEYKPYTEADLSALLLE